MSAIYVLPVHQPDADNLARGKIRQLARNYPCEPQFIGQQVAIQATSVAIERTRVEWAIVGVGTLAGVGLYPCFGRDAELSLGKSYKRVTGMAGAWGWTFTRVLAIEPIPLPRLAPASGRWDPGLDRRIWEWEDDGGGDWWSCCLRELDDGMVRRVQEARRKTRRG